MRPRVDLPQPEFADEADDLALADRQADVVDGAHDLVAQARAEQVGDLLGRVERLDEALRDAVELDDGRAHAGHAASGSPASG